eukprot:231384-Amphidinium_carterae.1
MPTQFDGRNPQFREWSGEVKVYLTIHNVHIEDYMDQSAKSVDAIHLRNIQDAYVTEDVQYRGNKFYDEPTEEQADEYEEWLEDINRYESENGAIADHVKIATIINHLKGPINQHLMLKVNNTTTFEEDGSATTSIASTLELMKSRQ